MTTQIEQVFQANIKQDSADVYTDQIISIRKNNRTDFEATMESDLENFESLRSNYEKERDLLDKLKGEVPEGETQTREQQITRVSTSVEAAFDTIIVSYYTSTDEYKAKLNMEEYNRSMNYDEVIKEILSR